MLLAGPVFNVSLDLSTIKLLVLVGVELPFCVVVIPRMLLPVFWSRVELSSVLLQKIPWRISLLFESD